MARLKMGSLLKWGAIAAGGFYAYGYLSTHGLPGLGTASASGGATSGGTTGGHGCGFITGQQYVAPLPNGQFEVVINGRQVGVFNSQTLAEQAYNKMLGC